MYKALYPIQSENINEQEQEIFAPFVNCYYIHSISILVNGIRYQEPDFKLEGNVIKCYFGFNLDQNDHALIDINYFYIKPDNNEVLGFVINSKYKDIPKSKSIISKHYVEGQFSLDNGLYKNAALNFGTVLEGLLNKKLKSTTLNQLIESYSGQANKSSMNFIRELRNKVHPGRLKAEGDVSRADAVDARNKLEVILFQILKDS